MLTMKPDDIAAFLLRRLHEVQARLGLSQSGDGSSRFADVIDSMGLVEFVGLVAEDCGVEPEAIERATGRRFSTLAELAEAMHAAGLVPGDVRSEVGSVLSQVDNSRGAPTQGVNTPRSPGTTTAPSVYVASVAVRLPAARQPAEEIDDLLNRPSGWFAGHTGIESRCLWGADNALDAAATAALECLARAKTARDSVSVLLATGEAPPVAVGLAQALHARIGLPAGCVALEVGGACTGLVTALWLGRRFLNAGGSALIVAVEAPSHWLTLLPGAAGETAALFGDGAGACLLTTGETGGRRIRDVVLSGDGNAGHLFQALPGPGGVVLHMQGPTLASRAVRLVAATVRELAQRNSLTVSDLEAVVVHGGNGRLPRLLARRLGLPEERIISETVHTGNLGSVSLPAAWMAHPAAAGPAIWAAIGAGLTWGAVLLDPLTTP
jgi:3-oxoacyl-[acyl-carrier-protein] synthase-3